MKKGIALLLTMALMLTGCGSSAASTGTSVPSEIAKETSGETQTEAVSTEAVSAEQTEDGAEAMSDKRTLGNSGIRGESGDAI